MSVKASKTQQYDEEGYEYDFVLEEGDEDEENDYGYRRRKLLIKPKQKPLTCGTSSAVARNEDENEEDNEDNEESSGEKKGPRVNRNDKLAVRRKSALDLVKKQIPKPEGSVPKTALPIWYEFSMNEKIPLLPAPTNYLYYSRGKLGEPLHRCHPFYTIWDERNIERVVGAPYTALHDPHAKKYMSQNTIKSMLKKQELINDDNEVLCSLKEFNKFRDYLRTQYNDEVTRAVTAVDTAVKAQREQMLAIHKSLSNLEGRQAMLTARRMKARELQAITGQDRVNRIEKKQKYMEQRILQYHEEKAKENLHRVLIGYEKEKKQGERLYRVMYSRLEARRSILQKATLKDIEVSQRRINDNKIMLRAAEKFKLDWIDSKYEHCKQRMAKETKVEETLREDVKEKARKRQRRVEHYRAMMPSLVEKKKEEGRRIWEIVRKYAMRWLEKVRKRLHAPKDVLHESVWIGKSKGVLDDTLKFLKELSGYEKMDDFVLNIIKLKRQIQQQIELEEAQEAAELAAAAAAGADGPVAKGDSSGEEDGPSRTEIPAAFREAVQASMEEKASAAGSDEEGPN